MRTEENGTSKKILDAALRLISKHGYAGVSMRDIAREAGVAISQISYHYRNKEGLFIALVRSVREALISDFTEKMKELSPSDRFIDFLCDYAKNSIEKDTDIHRLRLEFSNLAAGSELFGAEFGSLLEDLSAIIAGYIEKLAPQLEITKTSPPRQTARFIIIFILGVSSQYLIEGRDPKTLDLIDTLKSVVK
ncbi:MAG: TetR/AcrR family transcriptional regulator [Synergistes sp.]|nr:TetR/AcrR family transcriptional regulator [Synergistes sp.]